MNPRLALAAASVAWATAAASALADPRPAANVAQGLFEQAREEMKRGAYEKACPKLAESQRLDPSSGTLLNLVLCEEAVGKVASAWTHARELVDVLPVGDVRRSIAERKLAVLSPRVPRLSIRLSSTAPPGTRVALDDVDLGQEGLGVPVPIDPGLHRAVVIAPARSERTEEIAIEEGRQVEWVLEPGPDATRADMHPDLLSPLPRAPRPAGQPAPSGETKPSHWERWAAFGVGAAGLVAAGVLGALALDRRATVLQDCPAKQCPDSSGPNAAEQGQRFFVGAIAAVGVGAAGMGLGAYLVVRGDPGAPARATSRSSRIPGGLVVTYGFGL